MGNYLFFFSPWTSVTLTLASIRTTTTTTSMPLLGTTVCMALQDTGRRMGVQALVNSVASTVSEGGSKDVRRMV